MNRFDYDKIPAHMMMAIVRYVEKGIQPGGFLTSVITNDLKRAVSEADDTNVELIPIYVMYFYNEVPSACWGSMERHIEWLNKKRQEREITNENFGGTG